jgi:hypothetical protein
MKTIAFLLLLSTLGSPLLVSAEDAARLGLAERRAIKQYQETKWPELKKAIETAAGFEVPVEVKWDMIAQPGEADRYSEAGYWTDIFFTPLIEALKSITADQEGKDSLKKNVKQIVVMGDRKAPTGDYASGVALSGGVLTINFRPWTNSDDIKDRTAAIQKTLEKAL